jgi:hypothetical protein
MSEPVTEPTEPEEPEEHPKGRIQRFEDAVHDRVLAVEVAAEEAAGYGGLTAAREAAEAAVNPDHELGGHDDAGPDTPDADQPTP